MNIGIYIYENAEVLDFSGPFEVFATANRLPGGEGRFRVFLVAETPAAVCARGGYSVNPHFDLAGHPPIDVLIVAGGVHTGELGKAAVIDWISRVADSASIVASVCTGAFLLAEAGLLRGRKATTHWEDIADLRGAYPEVRVVEGRRWVDEGAVVSSGGISAGIDMSLHLVARLSTPDLARATARQMEFDWRTNATVDSD
ncbi:DJ-1/PfpI family protein [Parahaliea mediterranea]|uniref:DJ-1/PfpI family protein n=1 Tax=Parahaliea mediterranea TaxID=651086 RepID=A0A939DCW5_9GAMM|nr:DJ-1/PfpI family protein [Parahaliea mediterranea]MBN7795754.1 DJ-1/PfpI family protein [Parahaliea mediterranea]